MRSHHNAVRALADLEVLIVDCQATGANPAAGGCVLEMGWGVVRGSEPKLESPEAHWIALPEGHVVPTQVRKLTGYEPSGVHETLPDREAWERLRSAVRRADSVPTAIHFARFELPFLRDWAARFEPETPFPLDPVCLYAIANRLYPELPRQSLRALAGYLGHSLHLERRSLGHVEATAFVWQRVCRELGTRGITTWEELQSLLAERAPVKSRPKKPKYPLDSKRYRTLPDKPGVYRFLRSNGDVLYVGKATSLKKRVSSHFVGRAGTAQSPEMLTQVSDIATMVTESALEAALLENETIKELEPPYNTQLTVNEYPIWYAAPDFASAANQRGPEFCIGPLSSQYSLAPLGALIALLGGASPLLSLRAQAVGVSALAPPNEAVFEAGWSEFLSRHADALGDYSRTPHRSALLLAKQLMLSASQAKADEENEAEASVRAWDPARVARHLERASAQAFRSYRRAHWFRLLIDSDVVYREPESAQARLLCVRRGQIEAALNVEIDYAPERPIRRPSDPVLFDRPMYERLRVLTTELKRVVRDGGQVALHFGPRKRIPERLMRGVLSLP